MRPPVLLAALLAATVPLLVALGFAEARALWLVLPLGFAGWLVGIRLEVPVRELAQTAQRLRDGELKARPAAPLRDPWRNIAETMIFLAERLDVVSKDMEEQVRRRTAELNRKAGQLRALGQIGRQVASVLEPGALLHYVVRLVRGTFGYDLVAVIHDHGTHLIVSACAIRGVADPPVGRAFAVDDPAIERLVQIIRGHERAGGRGESDGETDPAGDGRGHEKFANRQKSRSAGGRSLAVLSDQLDPQSELVAPLRHGDRVLGAMVVQSSRPDAFDDDDVFTVDTIAGQVAVALENARLFETERRLRGMAVTEERQRIAREIHDTLAQSFMGILIHLRALRGAKDGQTADMHLREAETLAQQGLDEARRSVWNLRPARLHDRGLIGALEDELQRVRRQSGVRAELRIRGDETGADRLPAKHAAALLRIAQEALHNVVKHARARTATLTLTFRPDRTELEIADDGVGFSVPDTEKRSASAGRMGLISMAERARHVGGELALQSAPGHGTRVRFTVPVTSGPSEGMSTDDS